jgi:hypothetical protein
MLAKILSLITLADPANVKDRVTSICALLLGLCTVVWALNGDDIGGRTVELPYTLLLVLKLLMGICAYLIGWASGKNPDLSKKTLNQAEAINGISK